MKEERKRKKKEKKEEEERKVMSKKQLFAPDLKTRAALAQGRGIVEATVDELTNFDIWDMDEHLGHGDLVIDMVEEDGSTIVPFKVIETEAKPGFFNVEYSPKKPGKLQVGIFIDGRKIQNSPFLVEVKENSRKTPKKNIKN